MINWIEDAQELFEDARDLRRDFHRHPELGYQEVRTAGIVARELRTLGLEVTTGIAETGVVALLEGAHPGPVVMLRFDMDALPVTEETGAPYASQTPGLMHACGHDGHVAIGITVARLLHRHRSELPGTVKLVFQPAEEGLRGAERMIVEGVLDGPRPDFALGMHIWNEKPLGVLGITPGPVMAAAETFTLRLIGKGGHGAVPEAAIDPVVAAAQVVSALQSIPARNVSPLEAAVVSVTRIKAGETFNVIPPEAFLQGTIRTFQPHVRERVLQRFDEIVHGVGQALGCQVESDVQFLTPAVVNAPAITERVRQTAERLLPENPIEVNYRTMGSEDMAFFLQEIPGCYLFVGSSNAAEGLNAAHHHPKFDFDEAVLPLGAGLMAAAAEALLCGPGPEARP